METLTGSAAAQLLAGKRLCAACVAINVGPYVTGHKIACNALTVDPDDLVHAADAIAGSTACGKDANRWTWVIPAANPSIEPGGQP